MAFECAFDFCIGNRVCILCHSFGMAGPVFGIVGSNSLMTARGENIRFPTNFKLATRPPFLCQSEVKDIGRERCFDWLVNRKGWKTLELE